MSRPKTIARFTPAERFAHRSTAVIVMVLIASGFGLFYQPLVLLIGRRTLVEGIHVVAGFLLPLPTFVALLSAQFRADLGRLDRFAPDDWEWLRRGDRRRTSLAVDKFNAGQKLAAACFGAAGVVLFGTGLLLLFPEQLSLSDGIRQGATVVHDATTLALVALLVGHARLAMRHPEARVAMRTGEIDADYARREYAAWAAEMAGSDADNGALDAEPGTGAVGEAAHPPS